MNTGKRQEVPKLTCKDTELVISCINEIPKVPRGIGQHLKLIHPKPRNEVKPAMALRIGRYPK